jgi:hypothetical protein
MRRLVLIAAVCRARHWTGRVTLAVALLFPIVVVALDHHGAERLPGHQHVGQFGESAEPHAHGFQVPHTHEAPGSVSPDLTPTVAPAQQAAILVTALLESVGLPFLALGMALVRGRRFRVRTAPGLTDQVAFAPPTPPPPVLVAI